MSAKTFYQTLYQSEHLFRVPTETAADWGVALSQQTNSQAGEPVVPPAVPPVRVPEMPVFAEETATEQVSESVTGVSADETTELTEALVEAADKAVETLLAEALPTVDETPEPKDVAPVMDTKPPVRSPDAPKPAQLKHKVLLLADEDLSPSDLLFLEKILKAVNLDINGVDLLNVYGVSDVDFREVLRHKYINHFITFGVPFRRINLDILMDRYQPIRFDGITFLMVDSLPVIEASQALKKQLWNSLKKVFEIGN